MHIMPVGSFPSSMKNIYLFQPFLQGIITPETNLIVTSDPFQKRTEKNSSLLQEQLEKKILKRDTN